MHILRECSAFDSHLCLRDGVRSLSVAAFRDLIASSSARHPMIISGLGPHLTPRGLDIERLKTELLPPELAVPVRGREGRWDSSRFFAALEAGDSVYLADAPVARLCPWLLREVKVPRYFLHCFTHRTRTALQLAVEAPPSLSAQRAPSPACTLTRCAPTFGWW